MNPTAPTFNTAWMIEQAHLQILRDQQTIQSCLAIAGFLICGLIIVAICRRIFDWDGEALAFAAIVAALGVILCFCVGMTAHNEIPQIQDHPEAWAQRKLMTAFER